VSLAILLTSGLDLERKLIGKPETTFNFEGEGLFPDLRTVK